MSTSSAFGVERSWSSSTNYILVDKLHPRRQTTSSSTNYILVDKLHPRRQTTSSSTNYILVDIPCPLVLALVTSTSPLRCLAPQVPYLPSLPAYPAPPTSALPESSGPDALPYKSHIISSLASHSLRQPLLPHREV